MNPQDLPHVRTCRRCGHEFMSAWRDYCYKCDVEEDEDEPRNYRRMRLFSKRRKQSE